MPWTREEAMAFVFLPSALTALADARLEVANGQEDGAGWSWRIRNTERGLVLERLQHGRRPFWEEVSLLAAYLPSAQDARSVRFRALLARAEKAEAEVAGLTEERDSDRRELLGAVDSYQEKADRYRAERDQQREDIRRLLEALEGWMPRGDEAAPFSDRQMV